jgi:hypothetical protein
MASKNINISVQDETDEYVSLIKIIPYVSGGFGIILPSLIDTHSGRLEKVFVSYRNHGTKVYTKRDESEQYSANDIVKFSYHPDGFVQFSSASNYKIKSGRNLDGSPKGLGVLSWPLSNPVLSGASMTISFWGLSGFKKLMPNRINNSYVFETQQSIRHPSAKFPKNYIPAYAMAMYIIPKSTRGDIIDIDGRKFAHLVMVKKLSNSNFLVRNRELIRVIEIPKQDFNIGISWFILPDKLKPTSGYIFRGPTDGKRGLMASYPAIDFGSDLLMKDLLFQP